MQISLAALLACAGGAAHAAWTEQVIATFGTQGATPYAGLVGDSSGNLYGTTNAGGTSGYGTVFKLTPPAAGQTAWTQTTLLNFAGSNGKNPLAGLIIDAKGNLYGTTSSGGAYGNGSTTGTAFKLAPPAAGKTTWTQTLLASFSIGAPDGGLIADASGNLYGVTLTGGTSLAGTVYKLTPPATGTAWTRTVLASFNGTNGKYPAGSLVADAKGNLYGVTAEGGASSDGTVFKLAPPASGQTAWTLSVLLSFGGSNGSGPVAGLIFDANGNLYGTTSGGGAHSAGTVFELSPPTAGKTAWTQTGLASLSGALGNGPDASLVFDAKGNLYGTAKSGGNSSGYGVAFELSRPATGQTTWTETVLTTFGGTATGSNPLASVIFDSAGNLYGTTSAGGTANDGVAFKLIP